MVPLVVEAAEQRKGPAAAGAQIPPSDYRVRKVRFLPSANTNAGRERWFRGRRPDAIGRIEGTAQAELRAHGTTLSDSR